MKGSLSLLLTLLTGWGYSPGFAQAPFRVVAYYTGNAETIRQYPLKDLTNIIYSFAHLHGDSLGFRNDRQKETLKGLAALKKDYPQLRVQVSLGGWGGCAPCSDVFSNDSGRRHFAGSVRALLDEYGVDGIDLDWEYPAIEGFPGHTYRPEDRANFSSLLKVLRDSLGPARIISFAAGGFTEYLENSVDWKSALPYVNFVNLMTYDLVNGYSRTTGHHTPLFSNKKQKESTDHCVQILLDSGADPSKLVIGAAFYARTWDSVPNRLHGLYQPGKFKSFIPYRKWADSLIAAKGYRKYYDRKAKASYFYQPARGEFGTFDDKESVRRKTRYALKHHLGGIMFWELTLDKPSGGLLEAITQTLHQYSGN